MDCPNQKIEAKALAFCTEWNKSNLDMDYLNHRIEDEAIKALDTQREVILDIGSPGIFWHAIPILYHPKNRVAIKVYFSGYSGGGFNLKDNVMTAMMYTHDLVDDANDLLCESLIFLVNIDYRHYFIARGDIVSKTNDKFIVTFDKVVEDIDGKIKLLTTAKDYLHGGGSIYDIIKADSVFFPYTAIKNGFAVKKYYEVGDSEIRRANLMNYRIRNTVNTLTLGKRFGPPLIYDYLGYEKEVKFGEGPRVFYS